MQKITLCPIPIKMRDTGQKSHCVKLHRRHSRRGITRKRAPRHGRGCSGTAADGSFCSCSKGLTSKRQSICKGHLARLSSDIYRKPRKTPVVAINTSYSQTIACDSSCLSRDGVPRPNSCGLPSHVLRHDLSKSETYGGFPCDRLFAVFLVSSSEPGLERPRTHLISSLSLSPTEKAPQSFSSPRFCFSLPSSRGLFMHGSGAASDSCGSAIQVLRDLCESECEALVFFGLRDACLRGDPLRPAHLHLSSFTERWMCFHQRVVFHAPLF